MLVTNDFVVVAYFLNTFGVVEVLFEAIVAELVVDILLFDGSVQPSTEVVVVNGDITEVVDFSSLLRVALLAGEFRTTAGINQ